MKRGESVELNNYWSGLHIFTLMLLLWKKKGAQASSKLNPNHVKKTHCCSLQKCFINLNESDINAPGKEDLILTII